MTLGAIYFIHWNIMSCWIWSLQVWLIQLSSLELGYCDLLHVLLWSWKYRKHWSKCLLLANNPTSSKVWVILLSNSNYFPLFVIKIEQYNCVPQSSSEGTQASMLGEWKLCSVTAVYSWNNHFDYSRLIINRYAFNHSEENEVPFSSFHPELGLGAQMI